MKFRLEFDIKKPEQLVTHRDQLLLIGSCFTENIGQKLKHYKFSVLENPHGILFNPVSVAEALISCIENRRIGEEELFNLNEGWHSWKHHSRFSALTPGDALSKMNASTANAHAYLGKADVLMITLGSAWTYTLTGKSPHGTPGSVVSNNHKAPAEWFQRKLLSTEEVLQVLDHLIHRLFHFNPKLRIIFTISPVRHLREGVVENNRSKAVLIQAVHHLVDKFERLYYFPAYELVMDDLRDYRYYAEDLVHPNYFATQYVWEKLVAACMPEKTRSLMEEIHSINLAHKHKPFHEGTERHQQFLASYLEKTNKLAEQFPYLDFSEEKKHFGGNVEL